MDIKRKIAGITALCLAFTAGAAVSPRFTRAASVFGDINGDGKVDAKDASIILAYYSYLSTTEGEPLSLEAYLGKGSDEPTTTTTSETSTTTSITTTTAATTTQPTPSFDPNTYEWADIDYDDVDTNISNYTVDGTLYLGMIVKKLNDEFSKGYDISDLSEYSITDSSIYIRRLIRSNITNDPTMDYEFWYSKGEYSRFNPHFVRLNHNYEYLFSGSSNDLIRVDLNGQTAEFPKDEMRVLVRAMTGPFSGDPDALVEFGYTCSID